METFIKTPFSLKLGKSPRTQNSSIHCSLKTLISRPTSSIQNRIICAGTGRAGDLKILLTKKPQFQSARITPKVGSGVLITTEESVGSPTVITNILSMIQSLKIGSGKFKSVGNCTLAALGFTARRIQHEQLVMLFGNES